MGAKRRISLEIRQEMVKRHLAGESMRSIGLDYGFSRQGVCNVIEEALHPERVRAKADAQLKKRLLEPEYNLLKKTLAETLPADHDLRGPSFGWDIDSAYLLAEKLVQKRPSMIVMKALVKPHQKRLSAGEFRDQKPQPPEPFDVTKLTPELAKDKDFVKYCRSDLAHRIRVKEYENALREWEKRQTRLSPEKEKKVEPIRKEPAVGERVGKHAGSRKAAPRKKKARRRK